MDHISILRGKFTAATVFSWTATSSCFMGFDASIVSVQEYRHGNVECKPKFQIIKSEGPALFHLVFVVVIPVSDVLGCAAMAVSLTAVALVHVTAFAAVGSRETKMHNQQLDEKQSELQQSNVPSSTAAIMEQRTQEQVDVTRHKFIERHINSRPVKIKGRVQGTKFTFSMMQFSRWFVIQYMKCKMMRILLPCEHVQYNVRMAIYPGLARHGVHHLLQFSVWCSEPMVATTSSGLVSPGLLASSTVHAIQSQPIKIKARVQGTKFYRVGLLILQFWNMHGTMGLQSFNTNSAEESSGYL